MISKTDETLGIIGNTAITHALSSSLRDGSLSHAYILIGPSKIGKATLAIRLAQSVNCVVENQGLACLECSQCTRIAAMNHADVEIITPGEEAETDTSTSIKRLKELERDVALKPYEGKKKVFILRDLDDMRNENFNVLLKVLEEPPADVLFVLTANQYEYIPGTVLSRCQKFDFLPVPSFDIVQALTKQEKITEEKAFSLAILSNGSIGWAIEAARDDSIVEQYLRDRSDFAAMLAYDLQGKIAYGEKIANLFWRDRSLVLGQLSMMINWWRTMMLFLQGNRTDVLPEEEESLRQICGSYTVFGIVAAIKKTRDTMDYLNSINNPNPRIAFEALMISIHS
ncbi:MAG: AAA family ATPase [Dehalococcoidia bacterium]|nr:AAA family ATPase [Dehalococcoidia bacterium]